MKYVRSSFPLVQMAGCFLIIVAFAAWQPGAKQAARKKNTGIAHSDTAAPKPSGSHQADLQLSFDSLQQQFSLAVKDIDFAKLNADVQKAMAQIDYDRMNRDINIAMKNIDWKKLRADVSHSLDSAKMAMAKIDWEEMKANMIKARQEAQKAMQLKINTDSLQKEVQESLHEAQKNLQSAQREWNTRKKLVMALEDDGLINADKVYCIELKGGELYINSARQSKAVTEKYKSYYPDKKDFTINNDGGVDL